MDEFLTREAIEARSLHAIAIWKSVKFARYSKGQGVQIPGVENIPSMKKNIK
jgi:hypothetical protein